MVPAAYCPSDPVCRRTKIQFYWTICRNVKSILHHFLIRICVWDMALIRTFIVWIVAIVAWSFGRNHHLHFSNRMRAESEIANFSKLDLKHFLISFIHSELINSHRHGAFNIGGHWLILTCCSSNSCMQLGDYYLQCASICLLVVHVCAHVACIVWVDIIYQCVWSPFC